MIDVLTQHIIFDVDTITAAALSKCGDGQRMRYECDGEQSVVGAYNGQADAIHGHRTFGHQQSVLRRCWAEPKIGPVSVLTHVNDFSDAIDVSLDKVSTESRGGLQRTFEVDAAADGEQSEIGFGECFKPGFEVE